jgi:hypothetical protein
LVLPSVLIIKTKVMETIILTICGISTVIWMLSRIADKVRDKKLAESVNNIDAGSLQDTEASTESTSAENADNSGNAEATKPHTEEIMESALKSIGCQPTHNQDGSVSVSYQGENFHIEFGGMYARVWDPMWAGMKSDDPDMPKVREAVNVANFNFGPTVVMTAPDENGVIGFHTRRDIMLHPACPDNTLYIKAVLDSFFEAKDAVRSNYQKLNAQQFENQKKRRPVGFTSSKE